jgi:hypothetical protein
MTKKKLTEEYNKLVAGIEDMEIFDGRGTGVDIYKCNKCKRSLFTRYLDKGVTPFTIGCTCDGGTMLHSATIPEKDAERFGFDVINWIRPTLEQTLELNKRKYDGAVQHMLQGGMLREDELQDLLNTDSDK